MAQNSALLDAFLTNASVMNKPQGFICEDFFPTLESVAQTGKIGKYGNDFLRIETSVIGGEGKYRRVKSISRSSSSYSIDGHGLEGIVTKADMRNVIAPFKALEDETIGLTYKLWLEKEFVLATAMASTSILTQNTTLSGTSQFSDYANSDPLSVFATARAAVKNGCGVPPDTAWMSYEVWNQLRWHPSLLELYKYVEGGALNDAQLASALGVKRCLVSSATYSSAAEGQSDSLAGAWGKHLGFGVLPTGPQLYQASLGYLVKYAGEPSRKVYRYNIDNPAGSTGVQVVDDYDFVVTTAGAGYLVKNAVA